MGTETLAHLPHLPDLPAALASAEAVVFLLFAAGVTAMTAIAFVLWLAWLLVKGVAVIVAKLAIWPAGGRPVLPEAPTRRACPDPVCRAINPTEARFCRQCGRMFQPPPNR